jgi:lipoate-protein ligase A
VRVWAPHRQVAFGRRDTRRAGYDRARAAARERGFEPVERSVGGRAVAYSGQTLAFAVAEPGDRSGIDDRYDRVVLDVRRALRRLGVPAERGEPADSFCPGAHSLRRDGKLAGVAQRVRRETALTAGTLLVADAGELAAVLAAVYDALDLAFAPDSVGSVADAGGPDDPDRVARAVERTLVEGVTDGAETTTVERVRVG